MKKITLCLQLLLEKANTKFLLPVLHLTFFFLVFPFFLFPSSKKDDVWLETYSKSFQVPTLPLMSKRTELVIEQPSQGTPCYFVADARAWGLPAGIIIDFHSPYITKHIDNASVHEHKAATRSCRNSLYIRVCTALSTGTRNPSNSLRINEAGWLPSRGQETFPKADYTRLKLCLYSFQSNLWIAFRHRTYIEFPLVSGLYPLQCTLIF